MSPTPPAPLHRDMAAYYVQRAAYYERVHHKPERQSDLRAMEAWIAEPFAGRRVLEIACGTGWWTPHAAARADAGGNTDQNRVLDDGSMHEVLKNFPTFEQARSLLGPRAHDAEWTAHTHYWILSYTLT